MDALTASAVMQRQDSYAAPPNYIGPPGRCQRMDDWRLLIVDCRLESHWRSSPRGADSLNPPSIDNRQSTIVHQSPIEPRSDQPDLMRISRNFRAR